MPKTILPSMSIEQNAEPQSPCVRNCCLDDDEICLGCFRSLPEICGWATASTQQRWQVLALAAHRQQAYANRLALAEASSGNPSTNNTSR